MGVSLPHGLVVEYGGCFGRESPQSNVFRWGSLCVRKSTPPSASPQARRACGDAPFVEPGSSASPQARPPKSLRRHTVRGAQYLCVAASPEGLAATPRSLGLWSNTDCFFPSCTSGFGHSESGFWRESPQSKGLGGAAVGDEQLRTACNWLGLSASSQARPPVGDGVAATASGLRRPVRPSASPQARRVCCNAPFAGFFWLPFSMCS